MDIDMDLYDSLVARGFVQQSTNVEQLKTLLNNRITFYAGFDPTADSLHVGSLVPIMAMAHLQRAGHFPIAIIGGGTALIGDPSGKTEARQMLPQDTIESNGVNILAQLKRYLNLEGTAGTFLNNLAWLSKLSYLEFLRSYGKYFRVNSMIKSEAYKSRLDREEGLSFTEFNYQILQAFDYFELNHLYNCTLQLGGDDQWGNILAGIDLIRRVNSREVAGLTFPLITTSRGEKMGKTHNAAIWLDSQRTSVFDFYQYWINSDDQDVSRFLSLFTFMSLDEITELSRLEGASIRIAKERLAFEVTALCHGHKEAKLAQDTSRSLFGSDGDTQESVPTCIIEPTLIIEGISLVDLLIHTEAFVSKAEARRLIGQGGIYINGSQETDIDRKVYSQDFDHGSLMIRVGKKKYLRVLVSSQS